jgi:hypothetical protein
MSRFDDDEDETTTSPIAPAADEKDDSTEDESTASSDARRVIKRGWGQAEQTKTADSPFAQTLKVTADPQLIKFLEDDPYTSFRQHWIERQGQRSFVCIKDMDSQGCPLCAAGDRPSPRFAFNVALLSPDDDPLLKSYEVGSRIIDSLKNFHQDPRQGPLPKHYWAVSRTGTKGSSQTNHQMVRERDLKDEWDIDPLTEDDLEKLQKSAYSVSIVTIPTRKALLAIAAEDLDSD